MPARRSESPSRPRVPRRRLHRLAPAAREAVANPGRARAPDRALRRCAPCSRETSPRARGARLLGPRTAPKPGSWTWRPPRGRQTRARRSERTEPLMRFERTVVKCASRRTSQKAQAAAEGLPERRPPVASCGVARCSCPSARSDMESRGAQKTRPSACCAADSVRAEGRVAGGRPMNGDRR